MKYKKQMLRYASAAAVLCCLTAGANRLIPLLSSVQIGTASAVPTSSETPVKLREYEKTDSEPAVQEVIPRTEENLLSGGDAENENLILWESDGSRAMHNAKPYKNAHGISGGSIIEKQYTGLKGSMFINLPGGGQVRNSTFWKNSDLLKEAAVLPELSLKTDGTPTVLIYHTHTTESYQDIKSGSYDANFIFRTTEPDKNMIAVGDAIAAELTKAGIGVIHADEIHDYPQWNGSYSRSAKTVREILSEYPSVCMALDIHRDAINSGTSVIAPVCTVNGKKSAQIMVVCGCDDGTMGMPNYLQNFHLACQIEQTAESMYPGFTRPVLFDHRKYNQHLTTGSLLIEVGSQGNTLDEAVYAGTLTGKALAETIKQLAEKQEAANESS